MIGRRYHIRAGATTTAGGTVHASNNWYKVDGIPLACDGDPVDCPACGTQGFIRTVMPRIPQKLNGKDFALSDDLCVCNCPRPPRLIEEQTRMFQLLALVPDEVPHRQRASASESSETTPYDEQPQLVARGIEGVPYHVETRDGRHFSGRAGPGGLLPRIETVGEDEYTIFWGDEAPANAAERVHG